MKFFNSTGKVLDIKQRPGPLLGALQKHVLFPCPSVCTYSSHTVGLVLSTCTNYVEIFSKSVRNFLFITQNCLGFDSRGLTCRSVKRISLIFNNEMWWKAVMLIRYEVTAWFKTWRLEPSNWIHCFQMRLTLPCSVCGLQLLADISTAIWAFSFCVLTVW